ncbi:iron ABC transporter permease [Alcanivorax sp. 24]|uniref:FecCD family ABC transporter permease n=1 Tax=Alcanivorax sp. 24 TaxID=2545266 RepID=UPI00105E0FAA|nr:iron ABC transporter permease [Alcanivorax sp. 24]
MNESLAAGYRRRVRRRVLALSGLLLVLLICLLADAATGPSSLGLGQVFQALWAPHSLSRGQAVILWQVRLPYAVIGLVVGAALGLAGAEMQTALNNPLASPYTLGVSAAATLGASLVIVLDLHWPPLSRTWLIPIGAFLCAALSVTLILLLLRRVGNGVEGIVLFGIAMVFALEAMVAMLQFIADSDTLQQIVFWTFGSLGRATWDKVAIVAAVLALCLPFSLRGAWAMTALRGGEEQARSAGIAVDRLRVRVLLRVSLLSAVAVAFVGTIGFVGLVAPHIARITLGEDHRFYLPGSALAGALMLSLASIASKSLIPGLIIPVGIVTALVGVPLFMALVLGQRRCR